MRGPEPTTGFKGLTADKDMWKVQVCAEVDGKVRPVTVGRFADPEIAAYAYNLANSALGKADFNALPAYPEIWTLATLVDQLGVHNVVALAEVLGRISHCPG